MGLHAGNLFTHRIRGSMLNWISALYNNPKALIKINNIFSDPIKINNSAHQGCPLSPLLFILSLEPLIRTINISQDIKDFTVHDREYKIAAYADDLLFFVSSPHISIPNLVKKFNSFGYISNFKINHSKSEALNVTLSATDYDLLKSNHNFKWDKKKPQILRNKTNPSH